MPSASLSVGVIFALIENHQAAAKALEDTLEILQKLELPRKRDEHDAEIVLCRHINRYEVSTTMR